MARLLDEIKKAAKGEKKALTEKFESDDGVSFVPDVVAPGGTPQKLEDVVGKVASGSADWDLNGEKTVSGGPKAKAKSKASKKDADPEIDSDDEDKVDDTAKSAVSEDTAVEVTEDTDAVCAKDDDDDSMKKARKRLLARLAKKDADEDDVDADQDTDTDNADSDAKSRKKKKKDVDAVADADEDKDADKDAPKSKSKAKKVADAVEDDDNDDEDAKSKAKGDDDMEDEDDADADVSLKSKGVVNKTEDNVAADNAKMTKNLGNYSDGKKHVTESDEFELPVQVESFKVTKDDLDVNEDITAIFGGSKLSEAFIKKASAIYEAAIVAKVNETVNKVIEKLAEDYSKHKEALTESMVDKIDLYLDKVVSEWLEENKPAVDTSLRTQVSESFMEGLKALFETHYIDIPKHKEKIVETLIAEKTETDKKLDEEINENVKLRKKIRDLKKSALVETAVSGLSENQAEKLRSLSESVEFENEESFVDRLIDLKEAYFTPRKKANTATVDKQDTPIALNESEKNTPKHREVVAITSVLDKIARRT
jgi:hypothetical protein